MSRAWVGVLGAAWLGCGGASPPPHEGGADTPESESVVVLEAVSTVPEPLPEAPPRPPRPPPMAAPEEPIALPRACADYLASMNECFQTSAPGAQDLLGPVMENIANQWREMIQDDPSVAASLAETCEVILDSLAGSAHCLPPGMGPLPPVGLPPAGPGPLPPAGP